MKNFLKIAFMMTLLYVTTGCGSEECGTCTVTQIIMVDGEEVGRQVLNSNQEFCGDELDAVQDLESTITQELGGIMQEVVTTVECM